MEYPLKIVIVGASGKMGQTLIQQISTDSDLTLTGAIDQPSCNSLGMDSGALVGIKTGVMIDEDFESTIKKGDYLIDFTRPEASMRYLEVCNKNNVKYILGTTGFSDEEKRKISRAAENISICFAPNMSVGVNLLVSLVEEATNVLHKDFDIEIIESHHSEKIDAPSGTAIRLGEVIAKAANLNLKENGVFHREGNTNKRHKDEIGFSTIRGGDIVGDHTVLFAGDGERIELTHKAGSRSTFAIGAIKAAKFLKNQSAGLFDMMDVLNLKNK
jgi:4-hydroxy-tetrahydrodipicolinate reductase